MGELDELDRPVYYIRVSLIDSSVDPESTINPKNKIRLQVQLAVQAVSFIHKAVSP